MTQEMLIPATVIGSWSFPGWFEKFVADVKSDPELFGPTDRDEAVGDAVRLAIDDQMPCRPRQDHGRRNAAGRFQPRVLRVSARSRTPAAHSPLGRPGARSARPLSGDRTPHSTRRSRHGYRISPPPAVHRRPGQGPSARSLHSCWLHRWRDSLRRSSCRDRSPDPDCQPRATGTSGSRCRLHPARRAQLRLSSQGSRVVPRCHRPHCRRGQALH